jgi:ATP-dependent DNA ligase
VECAAARLETRPFFNSLVCIDGELIAAGRRGQPDFLVVLHGRHVPTCIYAFDLADLNGIDLLEQPLFYRRARLEALLKRAKCNLIRFSEAFVHANALLAECGVSDWRGSSRSAAMRPIDRGRRAAGSK